MNQQTNTMNLDPNSPAFPFAAKNNYGNLEIESGLTKREHFAAMAMQGMVDRVLFDQRFEDVFCAECTNQEERRKKAARLNEFCAFLAVDMADALIAELNKEASKLNSTDA